MKPGMISPMPFSIQTPMKMKTQAMFRVTKLLGFTSRRAPDWRTVEGITEGFRTLCPDDPVRYDFSLTRFGIRDDLDMNGLLKEIDEIGEF